MNNETLQELFVGQLRDIYDAEKQLVKTLPKIAKAAESSELADAIRSHLSETETQVSRLEEIFGMVGVAAKGKPCKGMKGLLEEGDEAIKEEDEGTLRDLTLIAGAQRVEHYEMAAYGTAIAIAEQLGLDGAVDLLQQTEDEEKQADAKLTEVAMMLYGSSSEDEEEEKTTAAGSSRTTGNSRAKSSTRKSSH
jgi:ferritin-like metal-binding protein YciE